MKRNLSSASISLAIIISSFLPALVVAQHECPKSLHESLIHDGRARYTMQVPPTTLGTEGSGSDLYPIGLAVFDGREWVDESTLVKLLCSTLYHGHQRFNEVCEQTEFKEREELILKSILGDSEAEFVLLAHNNNHCASMRTAARLLYGFKEIAQND